MSETRRTSVAGFALELLMIVVGVFLGTTAEQWRSGREERASAQSALVNFRDEVARNREQLRRVRAYHAGLADSLTHFLNTPGPHTLRDFMERSGFHGTRSVDFDRTAWDLALATQALAHVDGRLAFGLSQVYAQQQTFQALEHEFSQGAFTPATFADPKNGVGLSVAMSVYLGDVNYQEPMLIALYDRLLPQLDSAIGRPPNERPAASGAGSTAPAGPARP